jgi:hypothetical protein
MTDMPVLQDKGQLQLSEQGSADREYIKDQLGLPDLQDGYRLAVAVALAKNLPPAPEDVRRSTVYGATVLDSDGSLRASVLALRDDHGERPYALLERLAEAGLRDLAGHLNEGLPIRQYLAALVPAEHKD